MKQALLEGGGGGGGGRGLIRDWRGGGGYQELEVLTVTVPNGSIGVT